MPTPRDILQRPEARQGSLRALQPVFALLASPVLLRRHLLTTSSALYRDLAEHAVGVAMPYLLLNQPNITARDLLQVWG